MWDSFLSFPRGRLSTRNFVMFFATLLVACFGYLLASPTPVSAADASWKGNDLVYEGETYKATNISRAKGLEALPTSAQVYQFTPSSTSTKDVKLIYFKSGDVPKSSKEATYIVYTLNPPNTYSNPQGETTVTLAPATEEGPKDTTDDHFTSCTIDAIGWMVCPIMNALAEGMDTIYGMIRGYLEVQVLTTADDSPIYRTWSVMRDLANVAFVIAIMVMIYSQLTNVGLSNYGLKKLLPRVIIAAILVNISYIVCSVAVDLSNILGYSTNALFEQVRDQVMPGSAKQDITWSGIVSFILTGGAAVGAGAVGISLLNVSIAGAAANLWYIIAPILLGVFLVVIVTFLILAARQAIIVILIVLAPLAFVAYLLPNTEKWFERWRDTFFTMLVMFPAFAAVFGGAQLAGELIIRSASTIEQVILGLGTMVAPLAITPLLLKLGGGLLNRFGGIVNNPQKGILDRYKNYNKERLSESQARNQKTNAEKWANGDFKKRNVMRRAARRQYAKKLGREEEKEANTAMAKSLYQDDERGVKNYNPMSRKFRSDEYRHDTADDLRRRSEALHGETEARHDAHWKSYYDPANSHFDSELYGQKLRTYGSSQDAKLSEAKTDVSIRNLEAGQAKAVLDSIKNPAAKAKLAASLGKVSTDLQNLDRNIVVEGERKTAADITIKGQIADAFKEDKITIDGVNIREYAGGIAGDAGANRVYAKAKSEIVAAYMEDVKNSRSVLSEYSLNELITLQQTGIDRDKVDVKARGNTAMIDAAMQEIVLTKGNNWSFQKTKDNVAREYGMIYDDTTNEYYEAVLDADGNAVLDAKKQPVRGAHISDPKEVERRRDVQQLFVDAANQSKLKIKSLSGTDRGNLETGTFVMSGQNVILRDINDKKINANRLAETDIDELMHTVQILRDDGARGELSDSARQSLSDQIEFALTDPQVRANIGDREAEVMGVMHSYLSDLRDVIPLTDKVDYESHADTKIPTVYKPTRLSDYSDGTGPA